MYGQDTGSAAAGVAVYQNLHRKLPRKGLDTFHKHFQELINVQKDYTAAITSGVMDFNGIPDAELDGKMIKEELLQAMVTPWTSLCLNM